MRFVDFHAELTSEKVAMGWYLDGRVSAMVGTHTHIPTADARILTAGTAYQTDCGMTGPYNSVIGVDKDIILKRFLTSLPVRMEAARGGVELHGVIIDVDESTGLARGIQAYTQKEVEGSSAGNRGRAIIWDAAGLGRVHATQDESDPPFRHHRKRPGLHGVARGKHEGGAARTSNATWQPPPQAGEDRRIQALSLAVYKINKLADHVHKSGRMLNDLRTLRRLLYGERQAQTTKLDESEHCVRRDAAVALG